MFNFNVPRYEKVVTDAINLRPQIEAAVDEICKEGYSNIFFIGCGGTGWMALHRLTQSA